MFPEGFVWGTGASSTQCEGAAPASNWIEWERQGRAPVSGEGNGFATRFAEDFAAYARLGLTHHRLSIEWARIEPDEGRRDPAEVERYRQILVTGRELGIHPWICLHHFTLPGWFAKEGGFAVERNRTRWWGRHVEFVAETFGDLAAGWKPLNEPVAYAASGWLGGLFPPGRSDPEEFATVLEATLLAKAEAAKTLRTTGLPVASIHNLSTVEPVGDGAEAPARAMGRSMWDTWIGLERDGVLRVRRRAPIERADLAGAFDLIGFSYYSAMGVTKDGQRVRYPPDAPRSPLGYSIWAEGLERVIERLSEELPGRALLVSEYGIGTDDDPQRAEYLRRGLAIVEEAVARGVDIRGFFHWTGVDNYEWLHGFDVKFGLFDRQRTARPSAEVLRAAALGPR